MTDVSQQLDQLLQGAADVISRPELVERLSSGRRLRVKLGLDPTASDLHLGHAVVLRALRRFQDAGHVAVLIVGDFTAQVGDPTGKSVTRPRLSKNEVDDAAETYVEQVTKVLDPDPDRLEIRRNSEWLSAMGMEDVLRLTARSTVARMLERNDFAARYQAGSAISLTEFMYPLLQGWDSVMVQADVELGGTDQLFNLLMGRHLQSQEGQPQQVVITTPILVGLNGPDLDGPKMSKSLGNYVGLSDSPNEQFGKVYSIPDALIDTYAQHATGWEQAQIDEFVALRAMGEVSPNVAKRMVASAVVDLYHGQGAGAAAETEYNWVHVEKKTPTDLATTDVAMIPARFGPTPEVAQLIAHQGWVSLTEARRLVAQGGVRLDEVIVAVGATVALEDLPGQILRLGKRRAATYVGTPALS